MSGNGAGSGMTEPSTTNMKREITRFQPAEQQNAAEVVDGSMPATGLPAVHLDTQQRCHLQAATDTSDSGQLEERINFSYYAAMQLFDLFAVSIPFEAGVGVVVVDAFK